MHVRADASSDRAERLPAPSDYAIALRDPQAAFSREDLQRAVFKRGPLGVVVQTGENTVVAKATIDGREVAVRCHVKDDPSREARFRAVDEHLTALGAKMPSWIVRASYLPDGMTVRGVSRPVSLMWWMQGPNLHQFVRENVDRREVLERLAGQWLEVTKDLRSVEYVHGDPSHRNIVIGTDGIRLIDPDVAWVPSLGGIAPAESGNPAFQHPRRGRAKSSVDLDNFPNIVIYLSLRALAADPSLWKLSGSEKLILDARDYREPHVSAAFTQMLSSPDAEVRAWTAKLMQLCLGDIESVPSLEKFIELPQADRYEAPALPAPPAAFVLPPNSRRASWLAAHLPNRSQA